MLRFICHGLEGEYSMEKNPFDWETLARYAVGDCTPEQTAAIDQWRQADPANELYLNRFRDVWQLSGEVPAGFRPDTATAWDKVKRAALQPEITLQPKTTPTRNLWYYAARIAAVLVIGVLLFVFLREKDPTPQRAGLREKTAAEANVAVTLADRSRIWLNKSSKLNYPEQFAGTTREVYLEGEAFFEVTPNPDKPFIIHAAGTVTKVLGTSFNVRAYGKNSPVSVAVRTGRVSFAAEKDSPEPLLLTPGEQGVWAPESGTLAEQKAPLNAAAWHTRTLIFRENTVSEVVATLNYYFGASVRLENKAMGNCHFTGTFKQADLTEILEALKVSLGADYTSTEGAIVIKGTGC